MFLEKALLQHGLSIVVIATRKRDTQREIYDVHTLRWCRRSGGGDKPTSYMCACGWRSGRSAIDKG